jgi:hypothetical protein
MYWVMADGQSHAQPKNYYNMKIYMQKQANMIQEDKIVCIHEFRDAPSAKSF